MKPIENSSQEEQIYAPAGQSQDTQFAMKGRRPLGPKSTRMRRSLLRASLLLFAASFAGNLSAQTTLSGDHIITGDLDVGTSGTNGNLTVTGETGGAASPGIKVTGDGGVLFLGSSGTGTIPVEGAGTRMMWYPGKSAFRVGGVVGTAWDNASVGAYSAGFGYNITASGTNSVAMGSTSVASGNNSTAFGYGTTASGPNSTAMRYGAIASGFASVAMGEWSVATGRNATAMGYRTTASGYNSTVMGEWTSASGAGSLAMGNSSTTVGANSMAMGYDVLASGDYSVALGYSTDAVGDYALTMGRSTYGGGDYSAALGYYTSAAGDRATAMGGNTSAYSYISMAVGRYNVGGGSATTWQDGDPLFEIGNGTGNGADPPEVKNRNALTVYKNGDIIIPKSQGDILMGEFGNPE